MEGKEEFIQWHPAFCAAMEIELMDEHDKLEFLMEYQISKKPMMIDLVIIKKEETEQIKKNIGNIFRKHNIVQYKSPDDYLSIRDFYKTYGYACFYLADIDSKEPVLPEDISLTYVCNHYPRKLIKYLEEKKNLAISRHDEGIYYLKGDQFAIQIIVTHELSEEENFWLQKLRKDLKSGGEIRDFMRRYSPYRSYVLYQSVADAVLRANNKEAEKEKTMCSALYELFADEFKEARRRGTEEGQQEGRKEGRKEGRREGRMEGIKLMILDNLGEKKTREQIVEKLVRFFGISVQEAEKYYQEYAA